MSTQFMFTIRLHCTFRAIIVIVGALSVLGTTIDIIREQRSRRTSSNQDRQYKKTDGDEQSKTSETIVASTNAAFLERCRGKLT